MKGACLTAGTALLAGLSQAATCQDWDCCGQVHSGGEYVCYVDKCLPRNQPPYESPPPKESCSRELYVFVRLESGAAGSCVIELRTARATARFRSAEPLTPAAGEMSQTSCEVEVGPTPSRCERHVVVFNAPVYWTDAGDPCFQCDDRRVRDDAVSVVFERAALKDLAVHLGLNETETSYTVTSSCDGGFSSNFERSIVLCKDVFDG